MKPMVCRCGGDQSVFWMDIEITGDTGDCGRNEPIRGLTAIPTGCLYFRVGRPINSDTCFYTMVFL